MDGKESYSGNKEKNYKLMVHKDYDTMHIQFLAPKKMDKIKLLKRNSNQKPNIMKKKSHS